MKASTWDTFVSKKLMTSGKNVSRNLLAHSTKMLQQNQNKKEESLQESTMDNTLSKTKRVGVSLTKRACKKAIRTKRYERKTKRATDRFSNFTTKHTKNHAFQKRRVKRAYANAKMKYIAKVIQPAKEVMKMSLKKAIRFVATAVTAKSKAMAFAIGIGIVVVYFISQTSAVSDLTRGVLSAVVTTSYTAEDDSIKGVDHDFKELEAAFAQKLSGIQTEMPGFDEYAVESVETSHDPYALAAYLTVLKEAYNREDVKDLIQEIFDKQYTLHVHEEVQKRSRTVTKIGKNMVTNPVNGDVYEEEYTYDDQEEYDYKILHVKVNRVSFESLVDRTLDEGQKQRYQAILLNKGNRPDLFADSTYAQNTEGIDYTIPGEALSDVKFARMANEAKKHVGTPYVWGGKSPKSGFDCSGFVSYVINHSGNGWNVGYADTQGLLNACNVIPDDAAKPGDIIFFKNTYNSKKKWGVSHVGIYLGDGMMVHAGHPVKYSSTQTPYWKSHFLCYGRLP